MNLERGPLLGRSKYGITPLQSVNLNSRHLHLASLVLRCTFHS